MMRALVLALVLGVSTAQAQTPNREYPERPIRLIVATAAGGASDILARQVGERLTAAWGQPVVVMS